ncbi:DUF6221 family protein [Streptomyces sp. 020-2-3H-GM]|uniref:DUF6221 family protein n=1 Tax=Streptomyces sp. 020-2-3H-GM TaxID=2789258 RepID=UPI00397FFCCB
MTDALVAFLKARYDEEAADAQDATEGPWFVEQADTRWGEERDARLVGRGKVIATLPYDVNGHLNVAHIARHDPARTLREVEAKRRIIERHSPHSMGGCRTCERPHWGVQVCDHCERAAPCPDLRDLATVYADHPDYLSEWRL